MVERRGSDGLVMTLFLASNIWYVLWRGDVKTKEQK